MAKQEKGKLGSKRKWQKRKILILFLTIPMLFLLYFTVYPIITMFYYSFTDWKGSVSPYDFVGVYNYKNIFTTESYRNVFVTAGYYLLAGLLQQVLSLFLAVIMNKKLRGSGFFKGIIFFPFIMNGVAVAMAFRMFYQIGGGLDTLMNVAGFGDYIKVWISDPKTCNFALAFIFLWKNVGYSFLIYLGTMQSISSEYYDAAAIDGAGTWAMFKAITYPNIKMIVGLMATFSIVNSISVFDIPYVLTNGKNGTNSFSTTLIETAFSYNKYGQACAMAICMLVIAAVVMVFKNIVFKEENENTYE
ncbi:sugar ABC transporter permease [Suilimivivens sp.]|uniref:carbohydrate ABC transporter permease n=1 Tax=Suilimivivens sp. TaxID=2981669 RepID=UPI00307B0F00